MADYASLPNVGDTECKLLSGGLAVVSHPSRQISLDGRHFYSDSRGQGVQYSLAPGASLTGPPEYRMMP